jgi:glycosyltransferase involved in cell wall biosynthesis
MAKPTILMAHSEASAVGLYRVWRPAEGLRSLGWTVKTLPEVLPANIPVDKTEGIMSWEDYSEGVDLISVQRSDYPEMIALVMAMGEIQDCPIVFEIDDDIYDVSKNSPSYQWFHPGSPYIEVVETFMRNVDALTVSTQTLADRYSKLNKNIYVLPNAQDPKEWNFTRAKNEHLTIGWAGGFTHYDDLYMIRQPIKRILRKYPDVRFRVIGCEPTFLAGNKQVEFVKGFSTTRQYPKTLANLGFDIGLAPVVDRPFNRGKSNIKWQEYSMLSIPTIASRVGEYREIEEGITGLLAERLGEWEFRLEQLIKDEALREEIGRNAKQYTIDHNNIEKVKHDYDTVYNTIIADHKRAK